MALRVRRQLPELRVIVPDMGAWWSYPDENAMRRFQALCSRSGNITDIAGARVEFVKWAAEVGDDATTWGAVVARAHTDPGCDFWLFAEVAVHLHTARLAVRLPKRRRTDTRILERDTYAQKLEKAKCRILDCWDANPINEIHDLVMKDGFYR
jgi:hypothetical protein